MTRHKYKPNFTATLSQLQSTTSGGNIDKIGPQLQTIVLQNDRNQN